MQDFEALFAAPGVFFASIEDDTVVLDINSDGYFCLVGLSSHLRIHPDGRLETNDQAVIDLLVGSNLARGTSASPLTTALRLPQPLRTSRARPVSPGSPQELAAFLASVIHAAAAFPRRSVKQLIGVEEDRPPPRPPCDDEMIRRAVLFDRWLPWTPFQGQCLYRAYTLRHFLRLSGLDARWVFGVRTWPFAAHCWLQVGDLLLDDDIDRVGLYTPIMVA